MKRTVPLLLGLAVIPVVVAFKTVAPNGREDGIFSYGRTAARPAVTAGAGPATDAQLARGKQVYELLCQACHMPDGRGMGNVLPPLAGADFMLADRDRAAAIVLHGLSGPIKVNGVGYNASMPPLGPMLTDQQVADVLTYVFNTWDNSGEAFTAKQIRELRFRE
jgi:mono/diheme cytochrome c family protein